MNVRLPSQQVEQVGVQLVNRALVGLAALLDLSFWSPGWLLFKESRIAAGESFSPYALSATWTLALGSLVLLGIEMRFYPHPSGEAHLSGREPPSGVRNER
jgi:hypothetical protein